MLKSHADRGKVDVISLESSVSRILSELQEAQFLQDDKEKYVTSLLGRYMDLVAIRMPYWISGSWEVGIIIVLGRIPCTTLKHWLSLFHATSKVVVSICVRIFFVSYASVDLWFYTRN